MATHARHDLPNDLPYGKKGELEASQDAVSAVPMDQMGLTDPQPGPSINRTSEFPNESLFEGSQIGPGAGPEAMVFPDQEQTLDDEILMEIVPVLEAIVDGRRRTSSRVRQMVRKYRSQLPPEADMTQIAP